MSFEKREVVRLIKRIGLEVDPRRINMSDRKSCAVFYAVLSDHGKGDSLSSVDKVNLVAALVLRAWIVFNKAGFLCRCNAVFDRLALNRRGVQKALVALAKVVRLLDFFGGKTLYTLWLAHHEFFL